MLQTANGSLTTGLAARSGDTILIRGGTSSVGLAAAVLAKLAGMTATTRREAGRASLEQVGVDQVVIDDGQIADRVTELVPAGVDVVGGKGVVLID